LPNPVKYKDKSKFMEDCMHQVKTVEGEPQEVSVGKCLGMWKNKEKKKKCASDIIRELSNRLSNI
jgi:hypothetical protein